MKSIERIFQQTRTRVPNASTYLCFVEAIRGRKYSRQIIARWFYKLVDPDDYDKEDARGIIKDLCLLSNTPEKETFQTSNPTSKEAEDEGKRGKNGILKLYFNDLIERHTPNT